MYTIVGITCKDKAWPAASQRTTDLSFMLCVNGESGILFLMNAIMNYDTLLQISA